MLKKSHTNQYHRLAVSDVNGLTDDSVMLTFDIPEHLKTDFQFVPGQYLTLRHQIQGRSVSRCYSICSPVGEESLSIAIRKVHKGQFSNYAVDELSHRDQLEVMPPMGHFKLDEGWLEERHQPACYVGVAGGSGITPIMSMIKSLLTKTASAQFVLFYSNRSEQSMMFRETLGRLVDQFRHRFYLVPFFTETQDDSELIHHTIACALKGKFDTELSSEYLSSLTSRPPRFKNRHRLVSLWPSVDDGSLENCFRRE